MMEREGTLPDSVASVVSSVRRTEIDANGTVGVVFEPVGKSDHFVVMLGGSKGTPA
jgi:hypothetical protein